MVLGTLTLYEWGKFRQPSIQKTEHLHKAAQEYLALGNCELALESLKPLLKTPLSDSTTCLLYAEVLRGTGQLEAARELIEKGLQKYPDQLKLVQEKARLLLASGQSEESLNCFRQCQTVIRSEADILDFACALYETERVHEAWQYLKELVIQSCNGRLLALAGDCQYHWKNYELAIDFYQQAKHYGWATHPMLARAGHCLQNIGDLPEAERCFRTILERDSKDVMATLGLGNCFETKELYERALLVYQSGQAWDSGHPPLLRQAGICAVHTGQFAYAELYLKQAVANGASSPKALAFLGYALEKQEKWAESEQVYLDLVEQYPDHGAGYRGLAWLYGVGLSEQTDQKSGLHYAETAVKLMPDDASWELLSACEARAGNFGRAHSIQEQLSSQPCDRHTRVRRRHAMRSLRKKIPLDSHHVYRVLVA